MATCEQNEGRLTTPIPQIEFRPDKDLMQEAKDRLLWQFKNSERFCQLINVYIDQLQELYTDAITAQVLRTLAQAEGVQLDVLGRLVGQERVGITAVLGLFGFADDIDADGFSEIIDGESVGGGRFIELGEPESGPRALSDPEYRRFIIAKIFKNHLRGATACELSEIAILILDSVTRCQLIDGAVSGNVTYYFYAPNGLSSDDRLLINSVIDDVRAERQRIIGAGSGVWVDYMVGEAEEVFGFDDDSDPFTGTFGELTDSETGGVFAEFI